MEYIYYRKSKEENIIADEGQRPQKMVQGLHIHLNMHIDVQYMYPCTMYVHVSTYIVHVHVHGMVLWCTRVFRLILSFVHCGALCK